MGKKYVYFFGNGKAEGGASMKDLLGGKGANLAEMTNIGIPVPPGFTISTEVCTEYYKNKGKYTKEMKKQVEANLKKLEKVMGKKFGDSEDPLLVSVRSGARVSMPGMMDTVLNLGLNDKTVKGLAEKTKNERFAWDCYRRFIQMYGDVVLSMKPATKEEHDPFEVLIEKKKKERGVKLDTELDADALKELVKEFKQEIKKRTGKTFPQDVKQQLWGAIDAVFGSWMNERAIAYRKMNNIPEHWGTAVNVQTMVYGNMGEDSATGVAFTRDPSTGEKVFFGEYLVNAQGEDVVAGIRTPQPINRANLKPGDKRKSMEELMPKIYKQLEKIYKKLEKHYRDMQDIEFTIEKGKLYLLQTRTGKRTGRAAVKIAVDMVKEGLISKEEAVRRVAPEQLDQLLHPMIDPKEKKKPLAKGLAASPGAVSGKVVFHADDAVELKKINEKVILVRLETSPEDIEGMGAAEGILTARGGMTSHAAVVARGMGKTCVAGCGALNIDYRKKQFTVGDKVIKAGDWITIDGSTGYVYEGIVKTIAPKLDKNFTTLMKWADEIRELEVWTNADQPEDAKKAREFRAQGIGLCRTEHMFFDEKRIPIVRKMIMNLDNDKVRKECLEKLKKFQVKDFKGILKEMAGLPVVIRLLDPPLHEFLPQEEKSQKEMAEYLGIELEDVKRKVRSLHELNPMLGHRGCRLGITTPDIYEMQVRAIMEAACDLKKRRVDVRPEIMIPLVGHINELRFTAKIAREAAEDVIKKKKVKVKYKIGTMIEIPRAALTADEIAEEAEFFSFGTNDLTQMTFGFSRDDAGKFLPLYVERKILKDDPFVAIEQDGIGKLMIIAVEGGRKTRPDLKIGICGEHGGEPESVKFCHRIGLNYVSCSPYRVPIARLAAAQAVLEYGRREKKSKKKRVCRKKVSKAKEMEV